MNRVLLVHTQAPRLVRDQAFKGLEMIPAETVEEGRRLFGESFPDALFVERSIEGAAFMGETLAKGYKGAIIAIGTTPQLNVDVPKGIDTVGILRLRLMAELIKAAISERRQCPAA